jgi:NADH-quinone oxidoreductase subunit B
MELRYLNLACCGVEVNSPAARQAAEALADIPGPTVVVVAGTVTTTAAAMVQEAIADSPEPRLVVAYGVCTISGGPYWDSPAVQAIAADVVVPGCPPRPQALAQAVLDAL